MALFVKSHDAFDYKTVAVNIKKYCSVIAYSYDVSEGVQHGELYFSAILTDNNPVRKAVSLL